jgi:CRP-like cAMP-binding protein
MFCERCPLREHSIIGAALSQREAQTGKPHTVRRYGRRQVVLREGEVLQGLYCIRSGLVKRSVGNAQGNRKILEILGPGDLLGIEVISENGARVAEAVTLEPSELCFFHRRELLELINSEPTLALALAAHAADRMLRAERALADLALKNARERLAGALLALGHRYGKKTPRGIVLDLSITRGELADLAGIALGTASRLFHELKGARVIKTRGRSILILQSDQLVEDEDNLMSVAN